jgi:hypothetical protein
MAIMEPLPTKPVLFEKIVKLCLDLPSTVDNRDDFQILHIDRP